MVSTELLRNELEVRNFKHLVVRPLGVDTELFQKPENTPRPNLGHPIFIFLGRLAVEKGVEDFLHCNLPGEKWVVGDGPQRYELEAMYPEVRFFGYKTGGDLVEILSKADVLVLPSRTETFGLVALEALSCQIPVAAYPAPGPSYIISDGIDGILSTDIEDAAKRCLLLDRTKCREKALKYSWENSTKAFLENLVKTDPAERMP